MEAAEYDLMDEAEARMWWYHALHARLLHALHPVRGPVLDAGCGTGGFLTMLARRRPDLARYGIEWDGSAAARAQAKSAAVLTRGSVNAMPFGNGAFAAAVSADVLCHRAVNPDHALAELRRVLRPGGRLVLNLPAYRWLMSAHDHHVHNVRRFTTGQARHLLQQAGFTRISARYWNGLLLPLMVVQRKVLARGAVVSDVAPFSPWLNATLLAVTELERHLPVALPAGGSVLVIAERP
ncbi:MAG TPA: class I SAM-dependent methyltransferase [Rhodopila sp.]|nr:class I SAM-dependent methyltransferase [Rhodopila sp.]